MTAYSFERYRGSHKQQIAQFQKQHWASSTQANSRYLAWKYEQNPYTPDPLVYVALHRGRVVGMRGMFGALWELGGGDSELAIPCAADSLVEREHRKTGLFSELSDFALADLRDRGYGHILNMSASPANYVTSVMTMGWQPIGSVGVVRTNHAQPDVVDRFARRWRRHPMMDRLVPLSRRIRSSLPSRVFAPLDRRAARSSGRGRSPITVATEPRPQAMADLVAGLPYQPGICHVRDEQYFSWRYRNPRATYRFLFWDAGATPAGYVVLGNQIGRPRVHIEDWEAADPEVLAGLLQAAVSWLPAGQGMQTWSATLSSERMATLTGAGFAEAPTNSRYSGRLLVKSLDSAGPDGGSWGKDLRDLANRHLRMIYSDSE